MYSGIREFVAEMNVISLQMLRYLEALYRHQSFSKAAEQCFISQPTLSTQIKKLEYMLGVEIIERHGKHFEFNDFGKYLVQRASVILKEMNEIQKLAKRSKQIQFSMLHIACLPTTTCWISRIESFLDHYSSDKITMDFSIEKQEKAVASGILSGRYDMALMHCSSVYQELSFTKIAEDPLVLVVNKQHPYASKHQVTMADIQSLDEERFILNSCLRAYTDRYGDAGSMFNLSYQNTDLETLLDLVSRRRGVCAVGRAAVKPGHEVAVLPIVQGSQSLFREIGVYWRKGDQRFDVLKEAASLQDSKPNGIL